MRSRDKRQGRAGRPATATPAPQVTPPGAPARRWRRHLLLVAFIWVAALAVYSNSFQCGFVLDNNNIILKDTRIQAFTGRNIDLIFHQEYWGTNNLSGLYRPLTTLSYLFNYAVLGNGAEPGGYHIVNFILHAANILLVYLLGLLILEQTPLAFAMAAVWALHPVLTESVTNIVGRADLLSALGVLGALLAYVRSTRSAGAARLSWAGAAALATAVGMFSKESAVVVVAVVALYDATFGRDTAWRARAAGYAAVVVPCAIFLTLRANVLALLPYARVPFTDNPLVGAGLWTSRLTAVKVIGKYAGLLVWPGTLAGDYSYNQVPLFTGRLNSWEEWSALLALAGCAAALALAAWCYRRCRVVCFLLLFFFVTLAPTANIAILIGTIMAERFLYLPSIAFAGCLVWGGWALCRRLPETWNGTRRVAPVALAAICLALGARAHIRNYDWKDDLTFAASLVQAAPDSFKTHLGLSYALARGQGAGLAAATSEAERAVAILDSLPDHRNNTVVYVNAGTLYRRHGDAVAARHPDQPPASTPEARVWYQKSLDTLLRGKRIDAALDVVNRQANLQHGRVIPYFGWSPLYLELGRTYQRLAEPRGALEAFEYGRRIRLRAEFFDELARTYRLMGDLQRTAIVLFEGLLAFPQQAAFGAQLRDLYRHIDSAGCALAGPGGPMTLNLRCPLVQQHACAAAQNMANLYSQIGDQAAALAALNRGREWGCAAAAR